jgi:hypothetical protein
MGAGASAIPASAEEALAQGFTLEQIDAYKAQIGAAVVPGEAPLVALQPDPQPTKGGGKGKSGRGRGKGGAFGKVLLASKMARAFKGKGRGKGKGKKGASKGKGKSGSKGKGRGNPDTTVADQQVPFEKKYNPRDCDSTFTHVAAPLLLRFLPLVGKCVIGNHRHVQRAGRN